MLQVVYTIAIHLMSKNKAEKKLCEEENIKLFEILILSIALKVKIIVVGVLANYFIISGQMF